MISIRRGVFETNSSSTHSITMCSENEYDKWKNGELYFERYNDCFCSKEDIINKARKTQNECIEKQKNGEKIYSYQKDYINAKNDEELFKIKYGDGENYMTYDEFWDYYSEDYETFEDSYTTEKNEKVIAFGYYGYDG